MNNFCPDCGKVTKGNSCPCGWKDKEADAGKSLHEVFADQLHTRFKTLAPEFQELIRQAEHDGFMWRGERQDDFEHAYSEYRKMQNMGVNTYRKQTLDEFRRVARRFT